MLPMFMALTSDEEEIALAIWYEYKDQMYNMAMKYLKNRHDAEDAVQDTLVRILRHIDSFYGEKAVNVQALVMIYMRGTCLNNYKDRKTENEKSRRLYDKENRNIDIPDEKALDPKTLMEKKETAVVLSNMIEDLDDKYKDVIILKYYYGYDYAQIAEALNITIDNVGVRMNRAKKQLAELAEKRPEYNILKRGRVTNGY